MEGGREYGGREGVWREGWSDGGRDGMMDGVMEGGRSDGRGREWCGVMDRGSSPGLVVARIRSLLPMSARRCPCPRVVACVRASSGCHVAASDVAPGLVVNDETGRDGAPAYLRWARPGHPQRRRCVVAVARWWWWMGCVVDGGGGKEATTWQCLSHGCHIWEATCRGWDIWCFGLLCSKARMTQLARALLMLL